MRLIDAKQLEKQVKEAFETQNPVLMGQMLRWIRKQKTIDAVPVVRCRDCQHWKPTGSKAGNSFSDMEYIGGCEFTNYCRRESDFCSYGELKGGERESTL